MVVDFINFVKHFVFKFCHRHSELIVKYSFVVELLFIVTPIVGVCNCSMFCCTLLYVPSSFAIVLMGKRELVALLNLSSWCIVIVVWLFLAVPWVCLQFVIVVFPDHTHLLFGSKPLLQKGISEPIFYGDLVNTFKRIVEKPFFPGQFKMIINSYKKADAANIGSGSAPQPNSSTL